MWLTNVWIIQLYIQNYWTQSTSLTSREPCNNQRYSSLLWPDRLLTPQLLRWKVLTALLLICGSAIVKFSSSCTDKHHHHSWAFISGCFHQNRMVCGSYEALACVGSMCEPVTCSVWPLLYGRLDDPRKSPPVLCSTASWRLCHYTCCLTETFCGSSLPMGLAPSQIPSLPGTAQPSWREMPAANYTQVDRAHRGVCAHLCLFARDSIHLCHRLH